MAARPPPSAPTAAEQRTSWFGVALGLGLGTLAAYHFFKLPPVLPVLLELYDYGMFAAGGFMSIYAIIGPFSARGCSATACRAIYSLRRSS